MQPTLRQVPPNVPFSRIATLRSANRSSTIELPDPVPMIARSKCRGRDPADGVLTSPSCRCEGRNAPSPCLVKAFTRQLQAAVDIRKVGQMTNVSTPNEQTSDRPSDKHRVVIVGSGFG